MTCFSWLLSLAGVVIVMVSLLRWFEEITEAVDLGWWNKVFVLLAAPFSVWFFPAKVSAGRPTSVPHHEPVRGFGTVPLSPKDQPAAPARSDVPPAGTPKEFLGKPIDHFFQLRLPVPLTGMAAQALKGGARHCSAKIAFVAPGRVVVAKAKICLFGVRNPVDFAYLVMIQTDARE